MLFKRCFACQVELPLDAFYKHPSMKDGRVGKCKECTKKSVRANRLQRIEYYRSYDRQRASAPHRVRATTEQTKRWRSTNPKRWAAQIKLNNALRAGEVTRQPCWVCGKHAQAHHPDYDRPLDVVWLCSEHHHAAHRAADRKEAA